MSTRKFDYEAVKQVYGDMNKTIGSASDTQSIAGILTLLDKEVHDDVGVCDQAVFGPLGEQLLLDWENTSSNFPNFIESFGNWSKLVAMSAGDYAQFEKDVTGFKNVNPLGTTSGGIKTNYVDSTKYSEYSNEEINEMKSSVLPIFNAVGDAYYVDTNRVVLEKDRKVHAGLSFGINLIATGASVVGLGGAVKGLTGGASASLNYADDIINTGAKALTTSADDIATTGAKSLIGVSDDMANAGVKAITTSADDMTGAGVKALTTSADDIAKTGANYADDVVSTVGQNIDEVGTGFVTTDMNGNVVYSAGNAGTNVIDDVANAAGKVQGTSGVADDIVEATVSNADEVGTGFVATDMNGNVIYNPGNAGTNVIDDVANAAGNAKGTGGVADDIVEATVNNADEAASAASSVNPSDVERVYVDPNDISVYDANGHLISPSVNDMKNLSQVVAGGTIREGVKVADDVINNPSKK